MLPDILRTVRPVAAGVRGVAEAASAVAALFRFVARGRGCAAAVNLHERCRVEQLTIRFEYAILAERSVPEISAREVVSSRRFKTRAQAKFPANSNSCVCRG